MNSLSKYIALLFKSREQTPQHQLELIKDIQRRGFLKQIVDIAVFSAFVGQCCAAPSEYTSFLPDMGDTDRTTLSPTEANFLGKQVVQDISNQGDMLSDYDILAYLNDIGSVLASYSPLAGQDFNFYIIRGKEINAFALPGGYICVYNGLVYCTQTEAELTAVMSHEISHVVQHHIFRNIANYQREQWKQLAGILAGGLMAVANPSAGLLAINSTQGLAMQNMLAFSRDFEREADRVGQKIMYNAGYDPHAMPSFFQRLKDANKFNDNEAYAFLRTHPVTSERLSEAEERANELTVKMRPDSPSFLICREKCRIRQIGNTDALIFYANAIKNKKYISLDSQYYGAAFASYLDKKYAKGLDYITKISDPTYLQHPATISLKAQLLAANGNFAQSDKVYSSGLESYPMYKNLWLGRVDLYMRGKQYPQASKFLDDLTQTYPQDSDLWSRMAVVNADNILNNEQKYYYALGNEQYLLTNYRAALDQYMLAIKSKRADPILNDVISTRITETEEQIKYQKRYSS